VGCEVWGVGFELWGLPVRQRLFGQLRHLHDVLIPGHSLHVGHANGAQNVAPALPPSGEHCLRRGARAWYEEAWLCRACVCARACVLTVSASAATHTETKALHPTLAGTFDPSHARIPHRHAAYNLQRHGRRGIGRAPARTRTCTRACLLPWRLCASSAGDGPLEGDTTDWFVT
jgi:hypothetical protein